MEGNREEKLLMKKSDFITKLELENSLICDFKTFKDRPFEGATSIITSGVSLFSNCAKELIFSYSPFSINRNEELESLIATYLDFYYFKNCCRVSIGDSLYIPNFNLIENFDFVAFFVLHPAYFPEEFSSQDFLWLIPIFKSEYDFIELNGSDKFQELIEEKDIDLTCLKRNSLIDASDGASMS